jgi:hypothetical protein
MNAFEAVQQLRQQLIEIKPTLSLRDQEFAESMLSHRNPSPKVIHWIGELIKRALAPVEPTVAVGSFTSVVSLFRKAGTKLKFPKVRLTLADGTPIILSLAGANSKAPGTINVMGEGSYPNREWFGRVNADGAWAPARSTAGNFDAVSKVDEIAKLLSTFGADPATVAAAYGKLTNSCCFCQAELTDARSVMAGFGPTCAKHYGLDAEWKAASSVRGSVTQIQPIQELMVA